MNAINSVIAVFSDHTNAEMAIKNLAQDGFEMKNLTIVGNGYHSEEKVIGFYNSGDRVKFWGLRGAFWGGLWGLFFGGIFMTIPVIGNVVMLGYLATVIIATIDNAIIVGGLSAIGAAIYSIGIPRDSVLKYESDIKADNFLVMAHGDINEVKRAREILDKIKPVRLDLHPYSEGVKAA